MHFSVALAHTCECTGKNYKTKSGLAAHKKTKVHLAWEQGSEMRSLKIELTKKDNLIVQLNADNSALQQLNLMLAKEVQRIRQN